MTNLVRSACLSNYAEIARSVGLDPYERVRSVGLSQSILVEPDLKIPIQAVQQLLEDSAALSGTENFGLRMAETRRVSVLGTLGLLVRDAPTLRHVLDLVIEHIYLHNESMSLHIEESEGLAMIRSNVMLKERRATRQTLELALGATFRIIRIYLPDNWVPRRVCFVHQSPVDSSVHRRMFGAALEFGCEFDGIVCKSSELDAPIASADPILASYARKQLGAALNASAYSMETDVRQLVLTLLPAGRCNVEQVAKHLSIDRRTVHRRLAEAGLTFSSVMNDARMELSERYLEHPKRTHAEIALLLGFSGSSAYSRWHQTQFGVSTSERRQQKRQH